MLYNTKNIEMLGKYRCPSISCCYCGHPKLQIVVNLLKFLPPPAMALMTLQKVVFASFCLENETGGENLALLFLDKLVVKMLTGSRQHEC